MDPLSSVPLYMIPATAFMMGLAGGAHCVAMCGPLATACSEKKPHHYIYQLGRLLSYTLMGIIAGFLGQSFQNFFDNPMVKSIPSIILCVLFIVWGINIYRNKRMRIPLPRRVEFFLNKIMGKIYRQPSAFYRSFSIGFFSVLLPCSLLYGVLISLTIFHNPLIGGIGMAFFALGTIPLLTLSPFLIKKILQPLKNLYPKLTSLSLISLGLITILYRAYFIYGQANQCH